MNSTGQRLTDLARRHGRIWFDTSTRICVGPRDTLWYAIALLFSAAAEERALGDAWRQVADLKTKELLERRYARINSYGRFNDTKADSKADKR